ncbi:MAG: hypothetical protein ACW990_20500 [Promethearchaeota archaeon]|jgi:hypothetical protein
MAPINKIQVNIRTGSQRVTYGTVFLGIAGREFKLDTKGTNFQPNQEDQFILGEGSNIGGNSSPAENDPRNPKLDTDDISEFPAYIRFLPYPNLSGPPNPEDYTVIFESYQDSKWTLEYVEVIVNPGAGQIKLAPKMDISNLLLGFFSGCYLYLK